MAIVQQHTVITPKPVWLWDCPVLCTCATDPTSAALKGGRVGCSHVQCVTVIFGHWRCITGRCGLSEDGLSGMYNSVALCSALCSALQALLDRVELPGWT